jgi:uncharacterized membrane protein YukC
MKIEIKFMYKKILIMILLIHSAILPHNLSQEQLKELVTNELPTLTRQFLRKEKLKELKTAQKKCSAQLEKVKFSLKEVVALTATLIVVAILIPVTYYDIKYFFKPGQPKVLE